MSFQKTMIEALRLTRAGKLGQATALIRSTIGGSAAPFPPAAPPPPTQTGGRVIDLVPRPIPESAATSSAAADSRPRATKGGRFEARSYQGAEGAIDYHLYCPADAAPGMPLVVMLHGCTQDPEDFARGTGMNLLADELGFLVAYPKQSQRANPQKCWNWFRPGDQQRDRGEPALLEAITRAVMADQRADPTRIYIAGLSAGGAAAAIMAAQYPDIFAAVGVHSGLPCGAARDIPGALAAMKGANALRSTATSLPFVPLITFHGDKDATVHEINSRQIVTLALSAAPMPLSHAREEGRSTGGRRFTRALHRTADGVAMIEQWTVTDAAHAWAGGRTAGSFTDPSGPDASREMLRFFLSHQRTAVAA